MKQISDSFEIEAIVDDILTENPDAVEPFLAGKEKAMAFLIGQAMRLSAGRTNPRLIREVLVKKLR